jgi:hypothetical protein
VKRAILILLAAALISGCEASPRSPAASTTNPSARIDSLHAAQIRRGVEFLVQSQQPEGCWGTGRETRGTEIYSMVPGSHDAFRVATTALCVMALREYGERTAHDKGVEYLIDHGVARRDDGALLYNIWAHIYALEALSMEMRDNPDPRIASAARTQLDQLVRYATYLGGWNYYDFDAHTQPASLGATSFGTAAGLVALAEAKKSGIQVPQHLVDQSLRRLLECRLPSGVYLYGVDYKYMPLLGANRPRGAVGRTQPANFALWLWGTKGIAEPQALQGLDLFFQDHDFLEMGRKRPFPHESWYQTSGYYYYFDHYYAARMIEMIDPARQADLAKKVADLVAPHQEPDGSWWDYAMWDYHKPYGTAFAVMTLLRCDQMMSQPRTPAMAGQ